MQGDRSFRVPNNITLPLLNNILEAVKRSYFFRCKVEAASPTGTTLSELAALTERLLADNRVEDAKLAARDEKVRERLYREYGIER